MYTREFVVVQLLIRLVKHVDHFLIGTHSDCAAIHSGNRNLCFYRPRVAIGIVSCANDSFIFEIQHERATIKKSVKTDRLLELSVLSEIRINMIFVGVEFEMKESMFAGRRARVPNSISQNVVRLSSIDQRCHFLRRIVRRSTCPTFFRTTCVF